jgi:predicted amidohydrolase
VYLSSPLFAGLAGFVCGFLALVANRQASVPSEVVPRARLVEVVLTAAMALAWGLTFGVAAWAWPDGVPAWGALAMPVAAVLLSLFYRTRAPRYWSWFLGSVEGSLPVVHIARLGTDLVVPALLALSGAVPAVLLVALPPSGPTWFAAGVSVLVVAGAVAFGLLSYRRAVAGLSTAPLHRVAALSAQPPTFDESAPGYADVEVAIARYQPFVDRAVAVHAEVLVLPEYTVEVSADSRQRWLEAVAGWARQAGAEVVAGLGQSEPAKDQLVIAGADGEIAAEYDKQHPAPGLEPRPARRTPPALDEHGPFPVSAVVCVDLDYPDLVRPVGRSGGVLAVPANDWPEIYGIHERSAVWAAVMAGVPVVRSAGHGISVVYDSAGRVVAEQSTDDGPVLLVADVPVAAVG